MKFLPEILGIPTKMVVSFIYYLEETPAWGLSVNHPSMTKTTVTCVMVIDALVWKRWPCLEATGLCTIDPLWFFPHVPDKSPA